MVVEFGMIFVDVIVMIDEIQFVVLQGLEIKVLNVLLCDLCVMKLVEFEVVV